MSAKTSVLQGLRVLAVDDDEAALYIVETILGQYGAVVRAVSSAAEALAVIGRWLPDVLVSDIGMPEENGYAR